MSQFILRTLITVKKFKEAVDQTTVTGGCDTFNENIELGVIGI